MGGNVAVVSSVVSILGISSAILGFAAERTRVKASQVNQTNPEFCDYPSTPAPGLGLAAAGLLVLAQIIIHVFAGCICCKNRASSSGRSWTGPWLTFIFSWIAFVIGLWMLISAAVLNMRRDHPSDGYLWMRYCYVVKPGISAGGAILALISVFLGIAYYRSVESMKQPVEPWAPQQGQGIAMGQPQFPPQPAYPPPPAFVHEDTYNRRQIP